jgi:DNA replication protein DnaC
MQRLAHHAPALEAAEERERKREEDREQQRRRGLVSALAHILGSRYSQDRTALDQYQVYHDAQQPIVAKIKDIAGRLAELVGDGRGIVLLGAVGTGKDHLLAALLYAAANAGISCRWVNGQELYGQFRDRMDTGEREEDLIKRLVEPQVLAISDPIPPAGAPTAWNTGQLYRLLDRRYRDLKSTWCSLNAVDVADADAKLSAAVFDRLREGAEILRCWWPSYRERQKA